MTFFRTAVETAVTQVASHWRGPHLLNVVLAVAGSGDTRYSQLSDPPVPNKPYGFSGRKAP